MSSQNGLLVRAFRLAAGVFEADRPDLLSLVAVDRLGGDAALNRLLADRFDSGLLPLSTLL